MYCEYTVLYSYDIHSDHSPTLLYVSSLLRKHAQLHVPEPEHLHRVTIGTSRRPMAGRRASCQRPPCATPRAPQRATWRDDSFSRTQTNYDTMVELQVARCGARGVTQTQWRLRRRGRQGACSETQNEPSASTLQSSRPANRNEACCLR